MGNRPRTIVLNKTNFLYASNLFSLIIFLSGCKNIQIYIYIYIYFPPSFSSLIFFQIDYLPYALHSLSTLRPCELQSHVKRIKKDPTAVSIVEEFTAPFPRLIALIKILVLTPWRGDMVCESWGKVCVGEGAGCKEKSTN